MSAQRQTTWSLHLGKEARLESEMLVGVGGRLVRRKEADAPCGALQAD